MSRDWLCARRAAAGPSLLRGGMEEDGESAAETIASTPRTGPMEIPGCDEGSGSPGSSSSRWRPLQARH
eukprot:10467648-Prorocentrum_lima.AAC.1